MLKQEGDLLGGKFDTDAREAAANACAQVLVTIKAEDLKGH
jgi:hypothetical protein